MLKLDDTSKKFINF